MNLPKIYIIATGWNCELYARKCVESVLNQQCKCEFHLIVINDGSMDGTEKSLANMHYSNLSIFNFGKNKGAAYRRWQVMNDSKINSEDVFLLLGLDDELFPGALTRISEQYYLGKWMTYGNWKSNNGLLCTVPLDFDANIHNDRTYRSVQYRSTAPNTFKKKLIEKLIEDDFKVNGEWVQSCTETNLMFCCLEMCGEKRIGIIRQAIYLYNEHRIDGSIYRWGRNYKKYLLEQFQAREKKPLYENFITIEK